MFLAQAESLFDDILEFLATSPSAEELVAYQPPEHLQARLDDLLHKNRTAHLTQAEAEELQAFLQMNRFMSRLRLKARQHLTP